MQKPIEERLGDIESDIARLTKMQGYVFRLLLLLRKTVHLFEARVATSDLITTSRESYHQSENHFLVLMFGGITAVGVAASLLALYFATLRSVFIYTSAVLFILCFVLFILGFLEYRYIKSQIRKAKEKTAQTKEVINTIKEGEATLDEELARVLAKWKELVPDDLVSESSNGTPEPKDSHDRS